MIYALSAQVCTFMKINKKKKGFFHCSSNSSLSASHIQVLPLGRQRDLNPTFQDRHHTPQLNFHSDNFTNSVAALRQCLLNVGVATKERWWCCKAVTVNKHGSSSNVELIT